MHRLLYACFFQMAVLAHYSVIQDAGVVFTSVGGSVCLRCFYNSTTVASHYSWYKQRLGGNPVVLSTIYKFDTPRTMLVWLEKHPRLAVQRQEGLNHLHISDAQPEDEAVYFCGSSHNNVLEFGEGIFLKVQAPAAPIPPHITQTPAVARTPLGSSVTMNCSIHRGTCTDELCVYWFKHAHGLGLVLDADQSPSPKPGPQSCTFHLEKPSVRRSDSGTYFCAVAACGRVLFGNGTVLQIEEEDLRVHIKVLVWLSVLRMGVLLLLLCGCLLIYCLRSRGN
ncbi:unnamed protein product [Knipowitschia caucasica]